MLAWSRDIVYLLSDPGRKTRSSWNRMMPLESRFDIHAQIEDTCIGPYSWV